MMADFLCGLAAGLLALELRFDATGSHPVSYLILSLGLPLIWLAFLALAGGYDKRFVGVGSDEFRRVLNAGVTLTAAVAILSYASKSEIARGYVVIALPCLTGFDLGARYLLRKRLHRLRTRGMAMRRVVAVGHARVAAALATELRRESYHGLQVVAACVADPDTPGEIDGIPFVGGLRNVPQVVARYKADTVAVLACPEMSGVRLRELAWELEKTGTDL
ncbi:MAG TPA: sugar transferase, partial [Streptosporangiaceae bacterium]|nr:sugar transferase [Streptosporangiaceae bacterium]